MSKRSPLALAVLALLIEEPMHPYRMQQLITQRGKDKAVNVTQRASLYNTIDRLTRDGLVELAETERDGGRPERSVYRVTDQGRSAAQDWMGEMLASPKKEFPEFLAALAHLALLEPGQAVELLRRHRDKLQHDVETLGAEMDSVKDVLPRVFLLDTELNLETQRTELRWLDTVLDDLDSGAMSWTQEQLIQFAASLEADIPELHRS